MNRSIIKIGSTDIKSVIEIQKIVGATPDGIFGPKTQRLVAAWQSENYLVADGIVGPKTMEAMGILDTDNQSANFTPQFRTPNGLVIERNYLPKGEYIEEDYKIQNEYIFLHHTAGSSNPYRTIRNWGNDTRGRIATEFVLGGQDFKTGTDEYDGVMLQAFPEGCQGWHLGRTGSLYMSKHSVAIELNSFGFLDDDFKNYVGQKAHESQICTLDEPFKKRKHWHKYSDKQIEALRKWILWVADRDHIDIYKGLIEWIKKEGPTKAFDFHQDAYDGKVKGLLTHTNVRKGKMDCFPQPELIDMLLSL
jgi:hypothetical protein